MKIIPLTQGYITVVSNEDYKTLKKFKWCVSRSGKKGKAQKYGEPYAVTYKGGRKQYMHRMIMGDPENAIVDHINHQSLDNRRENLRVVSRSENVKNWHEWNKNYFRR